MDWLIQNAATITISVILIIAVVATIRYLYRSKKNGVCVGCGESCSGCCGCHSKEEK